MSVVNQSNIPAPSSSSKLDPSPTPDPLPPLLTLNFSSNPTLRQVTTLLRRVWLLDPPLSDQELADSQTVGQCLQAVTQMVSEEGSFPSSSSNTSPNEEKNWDDDEEWKTKTQFRLLSDPVVISSEKETATEGEGEQQKWVKGVLSPWREEIYDVYRHVFSDFWRMVRLSSSSSTSSPVGIFEPTRGNAVSVAALPLGKTNTTTRTTMSFPTDTFLYPVWVNPKAKVAFLVGEEDGEEEEEKHHAWIAGKAETWTMGLWVQAEKRVVLRTERGLNNKADDDEDRTGLAAVFVTGNCDERRKE